MDDLIDDDFGDLYADVELQAGSFINSASNFTNLCTESEIQEHEDSSNNDTKQLKPSQEEENFASASKQLTSIAENWGNLEADGSDSEDDLNIVLNDEDCKGFPVNTTRNVNGDGGCYEEDDNDDGFVGVKNGLGKNGFDPSANGHGGEKGDGVKVGYNSQYPQYKVLNLWK